jgi:hypothetical protein
MTINEVAQLRTSDSSGCFICRRERSGLVAVRLLSRIVAAALAVAMVAATGMALYASL